MVAFLLGKQKRHNERRTDMNNNLLKKGRSAIAIVLSLALVLTTATFPVSIAKADGPDPVMPVVTELGDKIQPADNDQVQHYDLPVGYNFVYVKQGNGANVLWTVDNFESIWGTSIDIGSAESHGTEWDLFYNFLGSQLNPNSDLKGPTIEYRHGFDNFPFKVGESGQYSYEFTKDAVDGHISFIFMGGKVSHFYAGKYVVPNANVPLVFTKDLVGMDLDANMFDFTLSTASDTWVPGTVLQTVSNTDSENNNVVFQDLTFNQEGTFRYIIKELNTDPINGVVYDNHIIKLTVTVDEITTGVFNAVAVFDGDKVFTNTYEEEEYGKLVITKKVLKNNEPLAVTGTFTFGLFSDSEGKFPVENQIKSVILDNQSQGTVEFTDLTQGTAYYVFELDSDNNPIKNMVSGFVTDGTYIIDGQGQSFQPSERMLNGEITVKNNLIVGTSVQFNGTKNLTGRYLPVDDNFFFEVLEGDTLVSKGTTGTFQGSMSSSAPFQFDPIDYTLEDVGTHTYTVKELNDGLGGIDYDSNEYTVTVEVAVNAQGELTADVYYPRELSELVFNNTYEPKSVTWTPDVTKELTGINIADGMFEFTISQVIKTESRVALYTETVFNKGKLIPFAGIVYTEPGTYNYEITETNGNVPGFTYDANVIKVTVVVTDDGKGNLVAEANYTGGQVFNNTYEGPGSITVTKAVDVTKALNPVNGTFYAGLFTKVEDQFVLVKFGDEKAIAKLVVVNSAPATDSTTFVGLDLNETYYVFETDVDGLIIATDGIDNGSGNVLPLTTNGWYALAYAGNEIALTPQNLTGAATITNYFSDFEAPFDPSIKVIKTVTVNNQPTASNLTFYAGLFEDKELTKLVAFKPLPMKGMATAEASFAFYQDGVTPLKVGTTYYVAETNDQGKPLAGTAKELGFEITINGVTNNNSTIVLIEEEATVNIVNNFKKEEFPLTGDNSNMNLWLFLAMLGVAGAIAPFAFRKKEEAND
jgi:pilin isopeptide linkage protein